MEVQLEVEGRADMSRRFEHKGESWEVEATGMGAGAGLGEGDTFDVVFQDLSLPERTFWGSIPASDPNDVDDAVLAEALEDAIRKAPRTDNLDGPDGGSRP